jgi:hypothetical protein
MDSPGAKVDRNDAARHQAVDLLDLDASPAMPLMRFAPERSSADRNDAARLNSCLNGAARHRVVDDHQKADLHFAGFFPTACLTTTLDLPLAGFDDFSRPCLTLTQPSIVHRNTWTRYGERLSSGLERVPTENCVDLLLKRKKLTSGLLAVFGRQPIAVVSIRNGNLRVPSSRWRF